MRKEGETSGAVEAMLIVGGLGALAWVGYYYRTPIKLWVRYQMWKRGWSTSPPDMPELPKGSSGGDSGSGGGQDEKGSYAQLPD